MIQLSSAGKRFGPKTLFQNLDWLITPQDRVGLVGANGTGKSTLMKVLAGIESLDYGTMQLTRGMSNGYLPQDGLRLSGRTVFAECLSVFDELRAMEGEIETLPRRSCRNGSCESASTKPVAERYSMRAGAVSCAGRLCAGCAGGHGADRAWFRQGGLVAAGG